MATIKWERSGDLPSETYVCGHCSNFLASDKGYTGRGPGGPVHIYICHRCELPTFIGFQGQTPGPPFGNPVKNLPSKNVEALYDEARDCMKVDAYTASVLCCRKLLMNIAVTEGADEGKSFVFYVDYLSDNGFVPAKAKGWVDHIRKKANEATHQIPAIGQPDAEHLITFMEMILKSDYEYPAKVPKP